MAEQSMLSLWSLTKKNYAYLCFKITLTLSAHLQIKPKIIMITILDSAEASV